MEFAAAALSSIAATVAPAAAVGTESISAAGALAPLTTSGISTAVAGSGGGLLASVGGFSGIGSILSGAATIGSMLSTQQAGADAQFAYEQKALDAGIDAKAAEVQGKQRQLSLRSALLKQLGDRDVQAAASGVDLSFGSPVVARQQDIADSEQALSIDQSTTDIQVSRLRQQADMYRILGNNAYSGALAKAAGIGLTGAAKLLMRG